MPPSPIAIQRRILSALGRSAAAALLLGATLAVAVAVALPAGAVPHAFADPIFSTDARGDITTVGNVTTTCDPAYANENWTAAESAAACNGSTSGATGIMRYDGQPMPPINNRLSMTYVDVDADPTTFSSSTARLHIPDGSTVLWAGLHWNGATDVPAAAQLYGSSFEHAPIDAAERFEIRFATPASGGYRTLDAQPADGTTRDIWDDTNPGGTVSYGGFVDVTGLVQAGGAGAYTVADVQSCRGFGGCFGSWSLSVAFANRTMPPRNLNVWHGWQLTSPSIAGGAQEFTVAGITPPPTGPVSARIGVVQADGDRGLGPDSLDIASPSHPAWKRFETVDRPLAAGEDDWFNSTVNAFGQRRSGADATPNLLANLNQDIALVSDDEVIGNDDHSFRFRTQTASSESLYSQVVHSAVELYAPEIQIDKTVAPAGPVTTGDEVTWTLDVDNAGIDPIRNAVVTDPLPAGATYVPGSVRFATGGPAALLGPKTDQPGDDGVDWNPTSRTLTFRVGTGATASAGGTMAVDPSADGSHHLTITYRTRIDLAPDQSLTNEARAQGTGRTLDDPYGPLTTTDTDPASIAAAPSADLGIAKADGDAVVRKEGDRYTYGLTGTNAGPSPATGVTMTDKLDPMVRFVDSDDGCTAAAQVVTCPVGNLAPGSSAERTFVVEVVELPGPGKEIPNTAVIDGTEPNPDCADPTPDAACNHDDETTPQPAIDLGITKTDGDAVVRAVGDEITYTFVVTNAGPDDATDVTVSDELDPKLAFVASEQCTADGQQVQCEVGELGADKRATAKVTVRVVELPEAGASIPNLAEVGAAEPDPDCGPDAPDALCNQDDEDTPWIAPESPSTSSATSTPSSAPTAPGSRPAPRRGAAPHDGPLPRTGAEVLNLAVLGAIAVGCGAFVLIARRRATSG